MIFVPSEVFFIDFYFFKNQAYAVFLHQLFVSIYRCFSGKGLFQYLAFGSISHTIRTLNKARFCIQR